MSSPIVVPPLAGNVLASADSHFVVAEWRDPGGPAGSRRPIAPLHLHHKDDEAWYVLEGTLFVQTGKEEAEVRAGSGILVPRETPHTYWNPGPDPVRYLLVMTPTIFRLIQAIHKMKERSPAALRSVFREYDSEFLGA